MAKSKKQENSQVDEILDKGTNTTNKTNETTSQEKELQDSVEEQPEEVGKFEKEAEALFEHVRVDTLWFASDGIAFFTEYDAKNHAVGLEDKEVVEVKRK